MQALRNPGMNQRHWDLLSTDLGLNLHPDKDYTLDKALKQGLLAHLDVITKVADVASKEYSIEQVGRAGALPPCCYNSPLIGCCHRRHAELAQHGHHQQLR